MRACTVWARIVKDLGYTPENTLPLAGGSELRSGEGTAHLTGTLFSD